MSSHIVILTDFGIQDPFVGIMKGVITNIHPGATIIDLTHEIPAGDIQRAGVVLWQSLPYFPAGTIFLTVIDPGVGTHRQPIIIYSQGYIFIGPDNGIFTFVMEKDTEAWILENTEYQLKNQSATFHGRDIFAPAAGYSAQGIHASILGSRIKKLHTIQQPKLYSTSPGEITGEILHSDRFGNILTSLGVFYSLGQDMFELRSWLAEKWSAQITLKNSQVQLPNTGRIQWAKTFAEIPSNQCAFIIGSSGLIEIAAYQERAESLLNLESGEIVALHYPQQ
jgi:S-adenosylmethionine hydrolase